jgi:DNA-binding transcriptional regulator YiaG
VTTLTPWSALSTPPLPDRTWKFSFRGARGGADRAHGKDPKSIARPHCVTARASPGRWESSKPTEVARAITTTGQDLFESLTDALTHAKGGKSGVRVQTIEVPDVRAIRRALHMSQQELADTYRIPLPTLKGWE